MMQYECRILLVDDETELLQMVGKLLVKEGYKHGVQIIFVGF